MKRIILFAAALLLSIPSFADVVSMSQAEKAAQTALGSNIVYYAGNNFGNAVYGDIAPTYYIFTGNGKWAIISADDCATPVLMHGEGSFDQDNIPDNMKSLLKDINVNISEARKNNFPQSPEVKKAWTAFTSMTRAGAGPVEKYVEDKDGNAGTALWNQGNPYNAKCPSVNGRRCYAGCVASAMAIILRFHQWPATGKGIISSYTTDEYSISIPEIDIDGYTYNWADLPTTNVSSTWTETQKDKVADILYHCGTMVKMDYGPDGSGAVSGHAIAALAEHMSYSPNAVQRNRSSYTNQEWFNMIKAELDANRPILYSGQNLYANSGHAFVCDGYNSNNQVHINWGWGGSYNAWFAVCYLGEVGGEGTAVYSRSDGAIFGLVPAEENETPGSTGKIGIYNKSTTDGLTITSGTIDKNSSFTINVSTIQAQEGSYSGKVNIGLVDKTGTIKEIIGERYSYSPDFSISNLPSGSYYSNISFTCTITQNISFGDRICLCYTNPNGDWVASSRAYSMKSNGSQQIIGSIGAIDITTIDIPQNLAPGAIVYPGLSLGHKVPSSVTWYLDGTSLSKDYITITAGEHTFKVAITYTDNSHETITKKVTVQ